jgi:hypothetical protein
MSELIRREDAIKATWQEPSYTDPLNVLTEVRDRIKALPTASPWHRVEEKPDEHTNLWLHDERGNYHVGCVSTYRGYTEYIDMGGNTLHDIDYWMPIEPPKEDA